MKQNNTLKNYLNLGNMVILLLCCLLFGCKTSRTEWVHKGEWVYNNKSSHKVEIYGVIVSFSVIESKTITLQPNDSYCVDFQSFGDKKILPDAIGFPLEDSKDIECCIAIDGGKKIPLKPHTGIRDRNSYKVEEIGKRHYKFTFDITDELILGLSNSSAK